MHLTNQKLRRSIHAKMIRQSIIIRNHAKRWKKQQQTYLINIYRFAICFIDASIAVIVQFQRIIDPISVGCWFGS